MCVQLGIIETKKNIVFSSPKFFLASTWQLTFAVNELPCAVDEVALFVILDGMRLLSTVAGCRCGTRPAMLVLELVRQLLVMMFAGAAIAIL